ncbi:VOC family protein, partial [Streptomyces sp. A475]|uniref:VOC family protein n=1 Tax=Streptomyces sp. A475 TaxID=3131976 RepID=UPI0030C9CEF3
TVGVGPIGFPTGRAAIVSDRAGAVFGIWAGALVRNFGAWRRDAPLWLHLVTRDAFDAAIFYGEVLGWTSPGCCDVRYEDEEVVLVCSGQPVAALGGGAPGSAPDPHVRPHWQVRFTVRDATACARAAVEHGGAVTSRHADPMGDSVTLLDPEGARFTVFAPRPHPDSGAEPTRERPADRSCPTVRVTAAPLPAVRVPSGSPRVSRRRSAGAPVRSGAGPSPRPAPQEVHRGHREHGFAALVEHLDAGAHDPAVGLRP